MISDACYVLMDTWFTTEPMLKNILDMGTAGQLNAFSRHQNLF